MGMQITTNVAAIQASRNLIKNQMNIQNSFAQLSSGDRINKAADDAAGLAISENIRATIRSIKQANRNANDGISMIQVAEGGLNEIANIVVRLRELGVQAASDTVGNTERSFIQEEVSQLKNEIQRIAEVTTWGKTKLLNGESPVLDFQVGTMNDDFEDRISFFPSENDATLEGLDLAGIDFSEKEGAQTALENLDLSLVNVNKMRANIGAIEARMHHAVANQEVYHENMSAARMRIKDTDVAESTSELTRNQVLLNATIATLAQANSVPQLALKLLS